MEGKNRQKDITDFITDLGWEENENEIAVRISFSSKNDRTPKGRLSSLVKPGCLVGVFATAGRKEKEVARGYVEEWNPVTQNSGDTFRCTCYDALYRLQKSQDNKYYAKGTGTESIITGILRQWKIPIKKYNGPNVKHGKLKYSNAYVSDILLKVLNNAHKKGAGRYVVRMEKGYANIVKKGGNEDVYVFKANIAKSVSTKISTTGLVTRVIVVGKADKGGKAKVQATLNGMTEYGVRQKIYTRNTDESLADAKTSAQEILDEDGKIRREITVRSPDVPFIRKGDLVYIMAGVKDAYYFVKSIRHDCGSSSMTFEAKYAGGANAADKGDKNSKGDGHKVGDIVYFKGGTHYVSSYSGAKGYAAKAGKAKITKRDGSGKAHPWHLIHTGSGGGVYGWVDDGTFE